MWHWIGTHTFLILLFSFTPVMTKPISSNASLSLLPASDALSTQSGDTNIPLEGNSDGLVDTSYASVATTGSPDRADSSNEASGSPPIVDSLEEAPDSLFTADTSNKAPDILIVTDASEKESVSLNGVSSSIEAPSSPISNLNMQLTEPLPPNVDLSTSNNMLLGIQADAGECSLSGSNTKRQLSRFIGSTTNHGACRSPFSNQYKPGDSNQKQPQGRRYFKPRPGSASIRKQRKKPICNYNKILACCEDNPVQVVTVETHTFFNFAVCVDWSLDHDMCKKPTNEKCCKPDIHYGETLQPPNNIKHYWRKTIMDNSETGWGEDCSVILPDI